MAKLTKKAAFFRQISLLKKKSSYLSFGFLKQVAREKGIIDNEETLKKYLSIAVEEGLIFNAGKGWYTGQSKPVVFDTSVVDPLHSMLKERFPFLPLYIWSTQQINPWMHHLLGSFVTFVYVDAEGAESLAEFLLNQGWNVSLSPKASESKNFVIREKSLVVRPITRQFDEDSEPTVETVLVDLFTEIGRLPLMDLREFQDMACKLITSGSVDIARLQRLLGDKKKNIAEFLGGNQSTISENPIISEIVD